ncbi:MAG: GC-type dockerin domain-anchored protein [Phycisphaerales bacterium]|jgi:hypothetical protein
MLTHARTIVSATTILVLAGASIGYGQTITSVDRVNAEGETGYTGGVHFPSLPKVDSFTLTCPSDTFSKEIMSEATVKWNASVGTSAGVEWGPVKASVEAQMGVEIGQKKTITRTYNYGPIPWYSRRYCIFTSYGMFRIRGTDRRGRAFEVNIFIPEGTFTKTTRVAPDCPCPEVSRAADDARRYADLFPPASPVHRLVSQGADAIELAGLGGYDALASGLSPAVALFGEALSHGADESVLNGVMVTASMALEAGIDLELAYLEGSDPSTGGAYTDPDVVVPTDAAAAARDALDAGRAIAHGSGPFDRWDEALRWYETGVRSVFAAGDELAVQMEVSDCAGEGSIPASCCVADLDLDGRLTICDYLVFQNLFAAGDLTADLDGDGELSAFDFFAFQNAFDAGCP